jgi:lactoylglutathione lyase
MKFISNTIIVKDLDESIKFYEEILGLPLVQRQSAGPGMDVAFLGEGDTKIELVCCAALPVPGNIEGISLTFQVDSLDESVKCLEDKKVAIHTGPMQPDPHVKFLAFRDPSGVNVQFVEYL